MLYFFRRPASGTSPMERCSTEVATATIGAVQRMGRPERGTCTSIVDLPIPTATSAAPTGTPFAVSQNNSTIYLFDYFIFLGLRGVGARLADERQGVLSGAVLCVYDILIN